MNGQNPTTKPPAPPAAAAAAASSANKGNPLRPIHRPPPSSSGNPLVQRRPQKQNPALIQKRPARPPAVAPTKVKQPALSLEELRRKYGGWSEPKPENANEYPLVITKRDLKEGIRFHVMRFGAVADKNDRANPDGTRSVDPSDADQFTRPVTLSRRDANQPPIGRQLREQVMQKQLHHQVKPGPEPVSEEEAARIAAAKAEREAQRAADMAQIAPVAKDPNAPSKKPKKNNKQEKYQQVYRRPDESFQRESELRYEESLPWHLEDADGKNVWVGSYVGPLSETNAALIIDGSNFRMVPLEKYYKFKAKPPFIPYSIEQAESIMNKKAEVGRWAMLQQEKEAREREMEASRRLLSGPMRVKGESNTFRDASRSEKLDHDELDMSGDEFQDDDEQPALDRDDDEDFREAQQKIRRDQLGANLFGEANEAEVERQVKEEEHDENQRRELGKAVRKMLLKREKEAVYATDSDDDPFASSSEEEEEEEEAKPGSAKPPSGSQPAAPAKGSTTPSGKKPAESLKKGKKRPGSPTLSDASGNETGGSVSRKKIKKTVGPTGSARPSRATTPLPSSSAPASSNPNNGASAAGSSNAEPAPSKGEVLTRAELLAALPPLPGGITIGELVKKFPGRVGDGPGKIPKPIFIKMVKEVTALGADKLLRRKA